MFAVAMYVKQAADSNKFYNYLFQKQGVYFHKVALLATN